MIHTPYDGTSKPFTIGLSQLDPTEWIEVDVHVMRYLLEKQQLYSVNAQDVLAAEPSSLAAQAEVLSMLVDYLPNRYREIYSLYDDHMNVFDARYSVDLKSKVLFPLAIAGLLVQEDLLLMSKSSGGWRLVAASLCFPSAWILSEKFGRPLHDIHQPVPGFGVGTRNAGLLERMFDNLWPERPVMRWNWSLYGEAKLHYPAVDNKIKNRFGAGEIAENVVLRIERQTLRKLPISGDIIFTVRIHLNPLDVLQHHTEGPALASSIAAQISSMTAAELEYKGLTHERQRLLDRLDSFRRA
jgi:dimethylamine monooxygenase subunit A